AGREQLPIGGKGHGGSAVLSLVVRAAQQAAERPLDRGAHPLAEFLARGGVPDEDGRVAPAPRDDPLAVGREGQGARLVRVAGKRQSFLAGGEVPKADDTVV